MITSIFNKSKPINFVIVIVILFMAFVLVNVQELNDKLSIAVLFERGAIFLISVFSVFLLNFIVIKNKLVDQSSYHILLFSLFLALFPITLISTKLLLSNVFILLALRKIISMRTQKEIKKKLFDASFWIGVASVFYFWAILFFLLIFIALFLFSDNKIKDWIIAFTGMLTVFLLAVCYNLVSYNNLDFLKNFLPTLNFNLSNYNSIRLIVSITIVLTFSLWSTFFYVNLIKSKLKIFKPAHKIVVAALIIALSIVVFSDERTSGEFIFIFAPLTIITSNYIQSIPEKWFKDAFLATLIVAPIVTSFL